MWPVAELPETSMANHRQKRGVVTLRAQLRTGKLME